MSFIKAKDLDKIKYDELYLVDPYKDYYHYLHDEYLDCEIVSAGVFIVDNDIIKKTFKNVHCARISSMIKIYALTGFSKKMLTDLKNDIDERGLYDSGVIEEYGLVKININNFLWNL